MGLGNYKVESLERIDVGRGFVLTGIRVVAF